MRETSYHRPLDLAEADRLLRSRPGARLLAGGQTLIPLMRERRAAPTDVIDISRLPELRNIRKIPGGIAIGAGVRHHEVLTSPLVAQAIPGLTDVLAVLGDPQVRHLGTLGGAVAANDPAGDYPAALVGLGATVRTTRRDIPAEAFFTGPGETSLDPGEIVTEVLFPAPRRSAYAKFRNPASRYALVGVFLAERADGAIRVAVNGAAPVAFRATAIEAVLQESFGPAAAEAGVPHDGLVSDIHGAPDYRAHLVTVMAAEAIRRII